LFTVGNQQHVSAKHGHHQADKNRKKISAFAWAGDLKTSHVYFKDKTHNIRT